jgi:hypothetical protein
MDIKGKRLNLMASFPADDSEQKAESRARAWGVLSRLN